MKRRFCEGALYDDWNYMKAENSWLFTFGLVY